MTFDDFAAAELPALARYARVLTGDRQAAHDVLADALVAAQLRWKRIGAMEHPAAYVRRIVTTTYLGERRRWASRHIGLTSTGDAPELARPDPAASVDDRDQLHRLLAGLPRQQRAAIVLRYYLGLADAAIADELGCAPVTVRAYISRGLASLRLDGSAADVNAAGDAPGDLAGGAAVGAPGDLAGGAAVGAPGDVTGDATRDATRGAPGGAAVSATRDVTGARETR